MRRAETGDGKYRAGSIHRGDVEPRHRLRRQRDVAFDVDVTFIVAGRHAVADAFTLNAQAISWWLEVLIGIVLPILHTRGVIISCQKQIGMPIAIVIICQHSEDRSKLSFNG